jgi:hypothetical protein
MKRIALSVLALAGLAHADITYDNFGPNNTYTNAGHLVTGPQGPFTPWWTHAFPFVATTTGEISHVSLSLVHNGGNTNRYHVELRADAPGPGVLLGYLGQITGAPYGSVAQLQANSGGHVVAGQRYWLYIRGDADAHGSWQHSPIAGGVRAYSHNGGFTFQSETLTGSAGKGAMRIEVTPLPCYANCDGSSEAPRLTANDFQCFINQFVANDSYANCDGSTTEPVLTPNDFQCFLNAYAAGCP